MGYPLSAVWSRYSRLLTQGRRLQAAARRSGGALRVITSGSELADYEAARRGCLDKAQRCGFGGVILGVEGAHGLEGRLERMEELHALGWVPGCGLGCGF